MRKNHLGIKRLAVPVLTLALLLSSLAPGFDVRGMVGGEGALDNVIIETRNAEAIAAVNYDAIAKNYEIKVYVDNKDNEIQFTSSSGRPFIALSRTFVPYRIMSEALGAKVDWDNSQRKVTAKGNGSTVELFIGHKVYGVNGVKKTMDVEPFILSAESRTYIPARYLTEGLNYTIDFAQDGKAMYIVSFTQGQTEAERKAALEAIIKENNKVPESVVKDGKLTEEQIEQAHKILEASGAEDWGKTRGWVETPKDDPTHLIFEKIIKEQMGQGAIVSNELVMYDDYTGLKYFVVMPDNHIYKVSADENADGTFTIQVMGSPSSWVLK